MYSKAQIEAAMLETAKFLETYPERYMFLQFSKPTILSPSDTYFGKGCLLGWIGYFLGVPNNTENFGYPSKVALEVLPNFVHMPPNMLEMQFYRELESLVNGGIDQDAIIAAGALRQFVENQL